ncbi:hypothetical protein [Erythrobacter sp.]|jgi:hypothetical protein|uniref:hypothetical protein n=1 Tax=Erythrobacter sp. TaxID=1042 RepID=UPI002EBC7115|nr:hypothetical protein [Erythrobacter sp.]
MKPTPPPAVLPGTMNALPPNSTQASELASEPAFDREILTQRWFELTRETMPGLAAERGWPVRFDHCFQRILLDNAVGGPWREAIRAPAYVHAPARVLARAISLGEACAAGELDLATLNRRSLDWRGTAGPKHSRR